MRKRHPPLPALWLISDARNDAVIERALKRLPRGSGLIYRHYHLGPVTRHERFDQLARLARARGHLVILAASVRAAREWGADGAYGPASLLSRGPQLIRLVTAHSMNEMGRARRANAVLLSPVHDTASHPGARSLGPVRYRLLSRMARLPVIALGGMTPARARNLGAAHWAAIDGLSE